MNLSPGIRMRTPVHPGEFVKHEVIKGLGLTITEAATRLQISRAALSAFLNEDVGLSKPMARRIEDLFGVPRDVLMRMQKTYDIVMIHPQQPY